MDCSMPGLPVHHQLPESTQTHVHQVDDEIQPSHPLSSPSPPAFNLSSIRVFSNESALHIRWPKYWSFSSNFSLSNEHPGLISFRIDCFDLLQSKVLSRVFPNTTVQKHQFNLLNASHATDKDLVSSIFKQPIQLDKKQIIQSKMGRRTIQTFLQRRHTNGPQARENMLNIANY